MLIAGGLWGAMALLVIGMVFYRKVLTEREDDTIHLVDGDTHVDEQAVLAKKVEAVDKWGKILTVVLVVSGLAMLGYYTYVTTFGDTIRGM